MFSRVMGFPKLFGRRQGISKSWLFQTPYVLLSKPECVEVKYLHELINFIILLLFFCGLYNISLLRIYLLALLYLVAS